MSTNQCEETMLSYCSNIGHQLNFTVQGARRSAKPKQAKDANFYLFDGKHGTYL